MKMAKEISQQLAHRAEEIARYLLPMGKKDGNEWRAGSINGEAGQSLGIHLTGEKAGLWCDFSNPDDKGDLLDLWSKVKKLSLRDAIADAAKYLGIAQPKFEGHRTTSFKKPVLQYKPLPLTSAVTQYLTIERKLTTATIEAFKVYEQGQNIVFPYLRDKETTLLKYLSLNRADGKKRITVEPSCEPSLFGWHLISPEARSIAICEGEIDAMSLYQYGIPALSVPFGGGTGDKHRWIEHEYDRLAIYDEIFLCFDNDQVGEASIPEIVTRLGRHRCRIVRLPEKDANACLQAGCTTTEIKECFAQSKTLDPEELKPAHEYVDDVIEVFYPPNGIEIGYQAPWEKARGKVLFRPEELSVWTGINGHGKSQFVGQILLSAMKQSAKVCIASLELKPKRLLARLSRQIAGCAEPTIDYLRAIHQWYQDKLWLFDLVGTAKLDRLLEVFLYARQRYGIDVFVIDSLMKLDIAEDDYKAQKVLMEKLCDFKNQYGCHIHLVVHPRKGIDESQPPGKLDIKGTGVIADMADNCFTIWRNKAKEALQQMKSSGTTLSPKEVDTVQSIDCLWICDKQRNGEWEGKIGFWFHRASMQYLSHEGQIPAEYVSYEKAS